MMTSSATVVMRRNTMEHLVFGKQKKSPKIRKPTLFQHFVIPGKNPSIMADTNFEYKSYRLTRPNFYWGHSFVFEIFSSTIGEYDRLASEHPLFPEVESANISSVQYWSTQKRHWINAESSSPYINTNRNNLETFQAFKIHVHVYQPGHFSFGLRLYGRYSCCAKHLKRFQVMLRGEASLKNGRKKESYTTSIVKMYRSHKVNCSERGQHLDGWLLHPLQNGGSVVTGVWWRPVSERVCGAVGLCVHEGMKFHPVTDLVSSWDDGVCCHERRMPLLSRCQTSRGN
jgi:hypothetical protein